MGNTDGCDDNGSNPSGVSGNGSGRLNKESQNSDGIKAWDSANEHLFRILRLTTSGASRSVLLKFEQETVNQETVDIIAAVR